MDGAVSAQLVFGIVVEHLEARVREAIVAALDGAPQVQKGAVGEVAGWAATAAVAEFVDFLQSSPLLKSESISYRYDVPDPGAPDDPGWQALIHDDPRGAQR